MPLTGLIWRGLATMAAPLLRRSLRHRAARGKEWAGRLPEREGIDPTPRPPGKLVWIHAASVGESVSMVPVLPHLAGVTVLFTTGTVTSAALLAPMLGDAMIHRFVPLDVPAWVMRFLDHWRPDAAVFVESELWPNTLAACRARAIPAMLVNARMSERSTRGWGRVPGLARQMLVTFAQVRARSDNDATRLRRLGASNVVVAGDLKLAAPVLNAAVDEVARLRTVIGDRPVWLAASTHPGEEAIAERIHHALVAELPGLLTIIAPRHAGRGIVLCPDAPHRAAGQDPAGGLWVADTMGELGLLYRLAPVVFVGRSLVGCGGQNPWEPARLGCAIAVGPYTANFDDAVLALSGAGALTVVADAVALQGWVRRMLTDTAGRQAASVAGQRAAMGASGLPADTARAILGLIE